MKNKIIWLSLWGFLMMGFPSFAQAFSATAQVDRTRISLSDKVRLQVVVDGGSAQVDLSPIRDFQVLSSGTQSSRSYVNGSWKHEETYLYALAPKKEGVLRIPPLQVTGDDGTVATREIQILCSPDAAGPGPAFTARAELSVTQAVTGQQVIYTLRLLAPQVFAGANVDLPDFKGLDARELAPWKKYSTTENGTAMLVSEVRYLVQASAPGQIDIEPAIFTVQVPVRNTRDPMDSLFNDPFFKDPFFNRGQTRTVRVVSNPLSLDVRTLPAYSGDQPFSGLVGDFSLAAALDKARVKSGESVSLSIVVQGKGNVMDIGNLVPALDAALFKVYPDAPVEDITPTDDGLTGKKTFRLALVPKMPGSTVIPKVFLTYFHPGENAYKTIATQPLTLTVMPDDTGAASAGPVPASSPGLSDNGLPEKENVAMKNRDILDLKREITAITHLPGFSWLGFLGGMAVPAACFALFALALRHQRRTPDTKTKAREKVRHLIRKAEAAGFSDPAFLAALQNAMTALILARAGKTGETLTHGEARILMQETGMDDDTIGQVIALMATLDQARFGGKPMDQETGDVCLAKVRTWAKTLAVILMASVCLSLAPAKSWANDPAARFVDAVRAYEAGQFKSAAQGFEAIAASGIRNPALYYNLANAHLKNRELGQAILWYERALRLAPQDPDIRFNLAHARSLVKDRIDEGLSFWDILMFWKGWVSLKTLETAAMAASWLFFLWAGICLARGRKILGSTGIALLVLLLILSGATVMEGTGVGTRAFAVILKEKVAVRSGTLDSATPLFDLHMGAKVRVLEKMGNHIKIGIAGDKVGWVSLADAQVI